MGKLRELNEFQAKKQKDDAASRQAVERQQLQPQVSAMPSAQAPEAKVAVSREAAPTGAAMSVPYQPATSGVQAEKPALQTSIDASAVKAPSLTYQTWEEAEKAGKYSQRDWANAKIQEMIARGENPGEYLNVLSILGDTETPDEKAKRERREKLGEVFDNLGNLIGNAANLYYTTKGGQYIDLDSVNEKHQARKDQIKAKQDALMEKQKEILLNAKLGDVKAAREEALFDKKTKQAAAEKQSEREWQVKYDSYLKELDNMYKIGQIDYQTKARMEETAMKTKNSKELEDYIQANRLSLAEANHQRIMDREDARGGGSRATIRVPRADGNGYDEYRKNDLNNPVVISTIYHSLPETYRKKDKYEEPTLIEMQAAVGKALNDKAIEEIAPEIQVNSSKKSGKSYKPKEEKPGYSYKTSK